MCGITGIVGSGVEKLKPELLKMTDAIAFRGPDGHDTISFKNCVLGHRRLSIVDLKTGNQPMNSPWGASLTYNGEFYGYREVRATLNYPWSTTSDTELVLALYHHYGSDHFMPYVKGMFAFAIWDEKEQQLTAARDRFGEKPFYYALSEDHQLFFASEIKAILASGVIKPELNLDSIQHYLTHLYVHPTKTIYKNIYVLPPGHYLVYKAGSYSIKPYWQPPQTRLDIKEEDAQAEFKQLLTKAVSNQLIADVPVACFLSGGLDSSTITALASKTSSTPMTAISFSFGNKNNELEFSRKVAKLYNVKNIELHADDYNIAHWFERMAFVYDEPFADSSNIPTYLLCKLAAEHFKVVLTGDGGDELLAGYTQWYRPLYNQEYSQHWKDILRKRIKPILHPIYREKDISKLHQLQNSYFTEAELNDLITFPIKKDIRSNLNELHHDLVDLAMRMDIIDYMPGDILVKTDRASMANSLELRAPFLDVEFAEFCISLPQKFKIDAHSDKLILRKSFQELWPAEIRNRKKQGFGAPVVEWLNQKEMRTLTHDYLSNPKEKIFEFIHFKQVKSLLARPSYQTWILLTLALWMKKHL